MDIDDNLLVLGTGLLAIPVFFSLGFAFPGDEDCIICVSLIFIRLPFPVQVKSIKLKFVGFPVTCMQDFTRPMHLRTDANLYPLDDNSPKPVNHHLTLKRGPKSNVTTSEHSQPIISYKLVSHCKPLGPITKRVIRIFMFGYPHLTLKEGPKVKSGHIRRFPGHDFL